MFSGGLCLFAGICTGAFGTSESGLSLNLSWGLIGGNPNDGLMLGIRYLVDAGKRTGEIERIFRQGLVLQAWRCLLNRGRDQNSVYRDDDRLLFRAARRAEKPRSVALSQSSSGRIFAWLSVETQTMCRVIPE